MTSLVFLLLNFYRAESENDQIEDLFNSQILGIVQLTLKHNLQIGVRSIRNF